MTPGTPLVRFSGEAPVALQLLCFPYAGGGAQLFRSWQALLPPDVGVTGVSLPGREQRFREPPVGTWPEAVETLAGVFAREVVQRPYALFGHSLGARLAYELTHRLQADGHRPPELLVVSACRAPGVPPRWPPMHSMDGPALTDRLREMNGVPEEVLANRHMMALLDRVLRADLRLAETWVASTGRVGAPILALCGERDDIDPYQDMVGWRDHTSADFAIRSFPAGHFVLQERQEDFVATIAARLHTLRMAT
ncbi:alpha/beta fold hydrolase [Microtetraspora sp. NBRC 13810]|uniref:thioesterase II family protein n=1 Tax=Microtetraspora sp. NBRC 13810 TaxID=3030990 RepID=UPI002555B0C0|nr:alpha/beta fold hydrolase [Microtetraspora sp. NBRC 13810]